MEKYYLFVINEKYIKLYNKKSYDLYRILEKLYNIKSYDFSYGINIYKNICNNIDVNLLKDYFNSRISHTKINKLIKLNNKITYIDIKYPCIIVFTNEFNKVFKIFNIYNQNIFMCDFKNKNYFWLNKYIRNS